MSRLSLADLHLLLIEPSPTQQKIVRQHLLDAGIPHVDVVGDAQSALAAIGRHRPDLVVSAYYLPDMTATDLLHRLRDDKQSSDLPFLLVSSETRFRMLDAVRQAGVVGILPKPFSADDIRRALRASLQFLDPDELHLDHYDPATLRVLVVDDSRMARAHITRVLQGLGLRLITVANDGREGIARFNEQHFDLVVTDYNMPEMDGRELVQALRARPEGAYVPILMVTSEQDQARLDGVAQAGVSALCDKPFEPGVIRDMLRSLLEKN